MMQLYWVALKSIWTKEIHRFMRIWVQTLVPPVITMTLYFVIFGNLIGSRIGEMHGFTYMQFIVPGLIMMAVITNAYANVASSFFSAKFQRNIEELLVAPVPTHVIIAGYVGGGVARGCAWDPGDRGVAVLCAVPGSLLAVCRPDAAPHRGAVLAGRAAERGVCQDLR
jgi:ABC-2 type transport system permease protein